MKCSLTGLDTGCARLIWDRQSVPPSVWQSPLSSQTAQHALVGLDLLALARAVPTFGLGSTFASLEPSPASIRIHDGRATGYCSSACPSTPQRARAVSYTHLRAHE